MKYEPTLHKLPNGVTVILDPMDAATVAISVRINTGSRDEKPSEAGITHFCEHMLCGGTKRFSDWNSILDYVEYNSGTINAYTTTKCVTLDGMMLAENADVLLDVFADQLQNSLFDAAAMERERTAIQDELRRALDDEGKQKWDFVYNTIYGGAYSMYSVLGTRENLQSFSRKQLKMFWARRMSGKNCVICVSGKIDNPDQMLATIAQRFGWMPSFDVPSKAPVVSYNPGVAHLPRPDKNNTELFIALPSACQGITIDNMYQRMCISRFNQYLRNEMFRVLRMENGLVYGVHWTNCGPDDARITGFTTTALPENVSRAVALMAQTTHSALTTNPITDEFLKRCDGRDRLDDARWLESPEKRRDKLQNAYFDYGNLYDFYGAARMLSQMTAADVMKYTQDYLDRPVSIISGGANYDADVMQIWRDNIGHNDVNPMILAKNNGKTL